MPRDIALLEGPPAHLFEGPDKPVGTLMGTLLVTQWTDSLRLEKERQGRVMALRSNGERIAVRDAKEVLFRLIAAVGNPQAKGHDQITLGQNASAFYEMQEYLVARLGGDEAVAALPWWPKVVKVESEEERLMARLEAEEAIERDGPSLFDAKSGKIVSLHR